MKSKILVAVAFAWTAQVASAAWPDRPISIVVPFAAGGATDVTARVLGQHMAATLGQPVVVENQAGAGGTVGAGRVAKANPDGYTLLMGSLGPQVAAVGLYPKLAYEPRKDFEPVIMAGTRASFALNVSKMTPTTCTTVSACKMRKAMS